MSWMVRCRSWCATGLEPGMPLEHLHTTQALVSEGLLNHYEDLRSTFPKIGTKFDARSLFLSLIHRKNRHRSRTTPNKRVWKLSTSTQLSATWHTDSLDMVVQPCATDHALTQGCTNPGSQQAEVTKFVMLATNICGFFRTCLVWTFCSLGSWSSS